MSVALFVRVAPATRDLLVETVRGMNASRGPGDSEVSLGQLVERCVHEVLAPSPAPDRKRRTK